MRNRLSFFVPNLAYVLFQLALVPAVLAQAETTPAEVFAQLLSLQGRVEVQRAGAADWGAAVTNDFLKNGDRLRTGLRSRAQLRLSDRSVMNIDQASLVELRAPEAGTSTPLLQFDPGTFRIQNRERRIEGPFRTPTVAGAIRGTEYQVRVAANGTTTVAVLDGAVELTNPQGAVTVQSGEQGSVEPGQGPVKSAILDAVAVVQWSLYYPAVIDPTELPLDDRTRADLSASLTAYAAGDLLAALAAYPENRQPASDAERVFLAELLLSVGGVAEAESVLVPVETAGRPAALRAALQHLIAAVKGKESRLTATTLTASEALAESYYRQSRADLAGALESARQATVPSPAFGFAWARVAELEFSFGRTARAREALDKALELSPRNAAARTLRGFVASAEGRIKEAIEHFDAAIGLDGALGHAWLGRGLCFIRQGRTQDGRRDLQVAAALEPQRAVLHSYLGKAFSEERDPQFARKELDLAKRLDPADPTSWLYSALLYQLDNRINEGVGDLEKSKDNVTNRRVYRSQLLLDQDRAVRGVNLALLYQDAGMRDYSVREATRAANSDYANYSAHLFLANSYNNLRDPRQVNLRYETPWLSEFLLANLLAPPGAGTLSQNVSANEYSQLFERNRLGLSSRTDYASNGDWAQAATQYGTIDNTSYAVDVYYRSANGQRPNNQSEDVTLSGSFKQQLGPRDSVYFQAVYYNADGGDLAQYYSQTNALSRLHFEEDQEPLVIGGWHHEWSPESHTLFLASRFHDRLQVGNPDNTLVVVGTDAAGDVLDVKGTKAGSDYESTFTGWSTEIQQLWQPAHHSVVAGLRFQAGTFDTDANLDETALFRLGGYRVRAPEQSQSIEPDFDRFSVYLYDNWQIWEPVMLTAGLSYDRLTRPVNYRFAPLVDGETTDDLVSPKVGLTITPLKGTAFRGVYTRSLGGVSFDQSFRLEPVQVAGFNQAFRGLIPESLQGSVAGQEFETWGVAWDQDFPTRTYLTIEATRLTSTAQREIGVTSVNLDADVFTFVPAPVTQDLDFVERNLVAAVNQLVGKYTALGVRYRLSEDELDSEFALAQLPASDVRSILHQVTLEARFNHPVGFFGVFDAVWSQQSNQGYTPDRPGDDFWQLNLYAGWRFFRRRAEVTLGLLNLTDQDYQLNPLNLYAETYRQRTVAITGRFIL